MSRGPLSRQRGVAVITALLLTTLAITIVASLFWQQQVQVRSIENQRLQLQKQWILRGALDWTRLILREDARNDARFTKIDHLGEPWAVPLAETRLDQYVENARADSEVPDAALSGSIVDAQSRFNLTNLCPDGEVKEAEVAAFGRLLTFLQQNPALARATADSMAQAQKKPGGTAGSASNTSAPQPMNIEQVDDLLAVPGFTPEMLAKLKDFVVVLPRSTPVNVNTASAEVLAARVDKLSLSDATRLVVEREGKWFKTAEDFKQSLPGKSLGSDAEQIAVATNYFLVNGNVRLSRAGMEMQALIDRTQTNPKVLWIREN
jgi:general secretion pathway protein K